jgi:Domain of unknown function (DUF929)
MAGSSSKGKAPAGASTTRARAERERSTRKGRQAAAERARKRRRTSITAVAVVLAVVGVMVVVALTRHPENAAGSGTAGQAGVLAQHVPVSVLDQVAGGNGVTPPKALPSNTPVLEQDGKPEVLYIGAEYCPFCATERWPLVVALSRFGTFTNLGGTESAAAPEAFPQTQTFTFHGATYTSDVLSFVGVETNTNQRDAGGGYGALETPTAAQQALLQTYDVKPYTTQPGAIPFLMIGNRFVSVGASYDPTLLQGLTRDQIATALSDPTSALAQAVDGAANTLTAAICKATDGRPASVCANPIITQILAGLPSAS